MERSDLKQEARKLALSEVSRKEAASRLGLKYWTVYFWTKDLKIPRHRDTSKQKRILDKIISDGFYIANGTDDLNTLRIMKERKGIRIVSAENTHIGFLKGNEEKAFNGLINYRGLSGANHQRLNEIRKAFGIKPQ
ncbi:MAG: hypothetical protein OH316_00055 [Candidatus Parvarchaeota archaeon]|nr:hypothetical protein [Candidatus Parvarchaeota archaeon]MCW1301523.1 hypothetical protein [Candidatus Parvarchaeota archaeon]